MNFCLRIGRTGLTLVASMSLLQSMEMRILLGLELTPFATPVILKPKPNIKQSKPRVKLLKPKKNALRPSRQRKRGEMSS